MDKYIRLIILTMIGIVCLSNIVYAQLSAPTLTVQTTVNSVTASWTAVDNVQGYTLFLAPYPDASNIYEVDMENQITITAQLLDGSAFYIAVKAYNSSENSDFSNIEYFIIDSSDVVQDPGDDSLAAIQIVLNNNSITVDTPGPATVDNDNNKVTITSAGIKADVTITVDSGTITIDSSDNSYTFK